MAAIGLVGWWLRSKCNHVNSKCNSPCCTLTSREDDLESQRKTAQIRDIIKEIQIVQREGQGERGEVVD